MDKLDFLKKLEVELKISKNSPYTLRNYLFSNAILLDTTNKNPKEITSDDIKYFLANNMSNKTASSINLFLSAIRYAYLTILEKDPTLKIKRPKKENKIPQTLSLEEIKKLLKELRTEKSKLMVGLMYACGLRVSELINLKISDLNFDEKIGHVRQSKGKKDRMFNLPTIKQKPSKNRLICRKKSKNSFDALPHSKTQFRNTPLRTRNRHKKNPRATRTFKSLDDANLHSRLYRRIKKNKISYR